MHNSIQSPYRHIQTHAHTLKRTNTRIQFIEHITVDSGDKHYKRMAISSRGSIQVLKFLGARTESLNTGNRQKTTNRLMKVSFVINLIFFVLLFLLLLAVAGSLANPSCLHDTVEKIIAKCGIQRIPKQYSRIFPIDVQAVRIIQQLNEILQKIQ